MTYHPPTLELEPQVIRSHYSALSAHRECEAKWHYRYVLRVKAPDFGPKPEMHFGSWWGALVAAEGLERGRKLDSLRADPDSSTIGGPNDGPKFDQRTVTVQEILDAADFWWKSRDDETKQEWIDRLGQGLPERIRELYERWMDEYAEARKDELPLGFEVFWKRKLPRPKSDLEWLGPEADHLDDVELIGYIDEVYFDTQRGIVVVRDNKSHKVLKMHTAVDDMMDSQLQLYAWGATPLISPWGHGAPRAVAYDRVRSVAPKHPEVTKTAGTLSKGVTDYDLRTYLEWAKGEDGLGVPWGAEGEYFKSGPRKDQPKFGRYTAEDTVIEKLSTPAAKSIWFQRTRVPVNRNVVIGHLRAAVDTATDAWRTKRRVELTGDAPRSLGKACDWCDYAALCRARLMGGATGEYDLREFGLEAPDGATFLINGKLEREEMVMASGQ